MRCKCVGCYVIKKINRILEKKKTASKEKLSALSPAPAQPTGYSQPLKTRRGHGCLCSPSPPLPLQLATAGPRPEPQARASPPRVASPPPTPASRRLLRVLATAAVARPPATPVPARGGKGLRMG